MGDEMRTGDARVAVVHPLIESVRGGEKVFFELARMFPDAELFTLHYRRDVVPPDIASRLRSTFLQWPVVERAPFRGFLPLLPRAARSLPTTRFDLVVSSSSGWSHGAPTRPGAYHLCYMHTPPRYLWHERPPVRLRAGVGRLVDAQIRWLRRWDLDASRRVDRFLVNSETSRGRVRKYYGRDAQVVHPPVEVDRWTALKRPQGDHVVVAGELVPYKRFDLAVRACRLANVPLVVVGDGPQRRQLERLAAGGDVRFLGRANDETYADAVASARLFIHPGVEDFGIATVEALAAGVPVVGTRRGGTGEIVTDGTGVLVEDPAPEAYADAIRAALATDFDQGIMRARAAAFTPARFRAAIAVAVREALAF